MLRLLCWLLLNPALALAGSDAADPFATERDFGSVTALTPSCIETAWQGQPLDSNQLVAIALCRNPQTRIDWANARVAAAQWGQVLAQRLPTLDLGVAIERQERHGGLSTSIDQNLLSPNLSLSYLLFDFGGRQARDESARATLLAALHSQNSSTQRLILAVLQAYYQLIANDAAVTAARANEQTAETVLKAAQLRHQIGSVTRVDLLQAQSAYSQTRLNRQSAEGNARTARGVLANSIGLDADVPLAMVAPPQPKPDPIAEENIHLLIEQARGQRPDLAAAEAQVRAALANQRAVRSAGLPSLSLSLQQINSYPSVTPDSRDTQVGLQLSMPLFTGFADSYRLRASQAEIELQQARSELLDNQVALEVWQRYHALQTSRDTLSTTLDLLASAEAAAQMALGQYRSGVGTLLNLLTLQAQLANARLQHIQAQYNWFSSRMALAQALGQLTPTSASEPASQPPPASR
ncbi:MAG TPA: TolC family protein [Pseudomonadales bacterium]|nr:TolC family protein [Pseudomonadales bacterium]